MGITNCLNFRTKSGETFLEHECICPRSAINRNYPWSVEYYLIEIHSLTSLYLFYYVGTACLFKKQLRAPVELIKHLFKIGNRVLFVIIYIRPFH